MRSRVCRLLLFGAGSVLLDQRGLVLHVFLCLNGEVSRPLALPLYRHDNMAVLGFAATCEFAVHQRVVHIGTLPLCLSVCRSACLSVSLVCLCLHTFELHAYPQVERYAKTFWEKGSTAFAAADWERHVKSVEKGERKIEEITRYPY